MEDDLMEQEQLDRIHAFYRNSGIEFDAKHEVGWIDGLTWFVGKKMNLAAVDLELPRGKEKQWHLDQFTRGSFANRLIFTCHDPDSQRKLSFMLLEDESDGYRSSMDSVLVHTRYVPRNVFDCVPVRFQLGGGSGDDLIDAVCLENQRRILQFGTSNTDDYYPSFVGDFELTNMPANVLRAKEGAERRAVDVERQRKMQLLETARKHAGWGEF